LEINEMDTMNYGSWNIITFLPKLKLFAGSVTSKTLTKHLEERILKLYLKQGYCVEKTYYWA